MSKKAVQSFEQIELFSQPKAATTPPLPSTDAKKPFVPVQIMALESAEIKNNFMYMLRILINNHNRSLHQTESQDQFVSTLINEIKIKKGLLEPDIAVRNCVLSSSKK